jgi:hypothetical protein
MSSRKILIITYYWPPSGGVGVQRWMNYALQLKEKGWEPIIYTPENPQFEVKDESLLQGVCSLRVIKTTIWEPFNLFHKLTGGKERKNVKQGLVMEKSNTTWKDKLVVWLRGNLFIPDPRRFWVRKSVRFLQKFVQAEGIKTVITTGPPHSMHLIGLGLKEHTNITWLADFRDPWSTWDILPKLRTGPWAMWRHRRLERKVLAKADQVLTVGDFLKTQLEDLGATGKTTLLYNGTSLPNSQVPLPSGNLTIGYYGMLNEIRNPIELWDCLNQFPDPVNLRIGGIVADSIRNQIMQMDRLSGQTHFLGYLTHQAVQEDYARCHVLVLLLNRTDNAGWILPVKFFEYLAANRWILALGPADSELGSIMSGISTCTMLDYSDTDGITAFLKRTQTETPDFSDAANLLDRFRHANLAVGLNGLLNRFNA